MEEELNHYKKLDVKAYWFSNKSSKNLPGEKWKPIPKLEETHEISNYGRIRCLDKWIHPSNRNPYLRKGHLMSPYASMVANHFTKDFTYHVNIVIETKKGNLPYSIRRLVYHCFVKPIQLHDGHHPDYVILPKDNNGLNTHYKNLIKVAWNDKQKDLYQNNRAVSWFAGLTNERRKEMWEKGAHKVGRAVTQYDKAGTKIASFRSLDEASKSTGARLSTIGNAASGRVLTAGGYIWRYGDGADFIKIPADYFTKAKDLYTARVSRPVTQYDLQGRRVAIYKSAKEAARVTGIAGSNITACLHGRVLSAKGFIWKEGKGKKNISVSKIANSLWKSKKQPVICYKDGKKTATYVSVNKAEKETGIAAYVIRKSANSGTKKRKGLRWQFL